MNESRFKFKLEKLIEQKKMLAATVSVIKFWSDLGNGLVSKLGKYLHWVTYWVKNVIEQNIKKDLPHFENKDVPTKKLFSCFLVISSVQSPLRSSGQWVDR